MMSREEFTDAISAELQDQLPSDYMLQTKEVIKANDRPYTALSITKEGTNIGVVIYAENLYAEYEGGRSVEEIASTVVKRVQDEPIQDSAVPAFDREFVLDHVYFRMANASMNQRRFENVPTFPAQGAEDIALYPCVDVQVCGRSGVTTLNKDQIAGLDITLDELHSAAQRNTERRVEIVPLSEVLAGLIGAEAEMFDSPFFVTVDKEAGAGAAGASLFGAPGVLKQMEGDYYIIPSSVHEVLLLPKDILDSTDYLHEMVHDVNSNVLEPEDFLSDHVYESNGGEVRTVGYEKTAEKRMELG